MDSRERLTIPEKDFDDIVLDRKLGTNSNVNSIVHILRDIVGQVGQGEVTGDMRRQTAFAPTEYFDEMRGNSSIAVRNAIGWLMKPVGAGGFSNRRFVSRPVESCDAYEYESAHWNEEIMACVREVLKDVGTLMVYDYSNTVNAVLQDVEDWGWDVRVYIPRGRALDSGMPFIRDHAGSNLHFSLMSDCAVAYYAMLCDAALVRVKTFCGDGGFCSTAGPLSLRVLYREYKVPSCGITQFLKMDRRLPGQTSRKLEEYDMSQAFGVAGIQAEARLGVNCVGIELVPPKYITGYMTEIGYLMPTQAAGMPSLSQREEVAIFGKEKIALGMVQLPPLPGTYLYEGQPFQEIVDHVLWGASLLADNEFDGFIFQNFEDGSTEQLSTMETMAYMTRVAVHLRETFPDMILGVLVNWDSATLLAVAEAADANFIRVGHVYTRGEMTAFDYIEGQRIEVCNLRKRLGSKVRVPVDVCECHSVPAAPLPVRETAVETVRYAYAGGLSLSVGTADEAMEMMAQVREVLPDTPLIIGDGTNRRSIRKVLQAFNGACVGAWIKDGNLKNPVNREQAQEYMSQVWETKRQENT